MKKLYSREKFKIETLTKMFFTPNELVNGLIHIGFDVSENKDHCCLMVAKKDKSDSIIVLNEVYDEEANQLLKKLIGVKEDEQ